MPSRVPATDPSYHRGRGGVWPALYAEGGGSGLRYRGGGGSDVRRCPAAASFCPGASNSLPVTRAGRGRGGGASFLGNGGAAYNGFGTGLAPQSAVAGEPGQTTSGGGGGGGGGTGSAGGAGGAATAGGTAVAGAPGDLGQGDPRGALDRVPRAAGGHEPAPHHHRHVPRRYRPPSRDGAALDSRVAARATNPPSSAAAMITAWVPMRRRCRPNAARHGTTRRRSTATPSERVALAIGASRAALRFADGICVSDEPDAVRS